MDTTKHVTQLAIGFLLLGSTLYWANAQERPRSQPERPTESRPVRADNTGMGPIFALQKDATTISRELERQSYSIQKGIAAA
jgi:hypothetical protein